MGIIIVNIYIDYICRTFNIIAKGHVITVNRYMLYIVIFGVVFARLFYCVFYSWQYYSLHPGHIIYVWNGGMSFHGALIGVLLVMVIISAVEEVSIFLMLDLVCIGAPIVIFFGRIGNFINGELYGRVTNLPLGVIFEHSDRMLRHPSQLYEAFFEGFILFLILNYAFKKVYSKRKIYHGFITCIFMMLYSLFRFAIEFFREPDIQMGFFFRFFTYGQLLCFVVFCVGCIASYTLYIVNNIRKV